MIVTVCRDLSDRALSYDVEPGKLSDIFTSLELGNAVALVNGKIVEPETVVSKDDIVFIRTVPKGLVAGLAIAAGVLLLAGAAYAGYQIYQMRKQMEKYKESLSSFGNSVTNIPYVKGASNVKALDRSIPYIIGKARIAPYVLSEGWTSRYYNRAIQRYIPYIAGYGKLVLSSVYANGAKIYDFLGTTPQEGRYEIESGKSLYIAQTGLDNTLFLHSRDTYVLSEPGDQLLKKDNPNYADLIYVLPENMATCEILLAFYGLCIFRNDGKIGSLTSDISFYWSKDGGASWLTFKPIASEAVLNNGPIRRVTQTMFYMPAKLQLPYSAVSSITQPIQIKIVCNNNAYDGSALEDVYVQYIQSKVYDPAKSEEENNYVWLPVIDNDVSQKTCIVEYVSVAQNTSEEESFSNFALILEGVARTWDGDEWSATKTPTDNPAAWLLEVLTSDIHPQSQKTDAELDLDTFGELYEYCETEELTVSKVYVDGEPKEKIIQMLCDICFSTLYKNLDGKIAVATDKEKENAIAVINTQNCFSFTNKKDMAAPVDGLRVTFLNEANEYETDAYEVMRPGVTKDANSKIRALTADGITKYEQIVKYAWRLMAIESARPKVTTVEIGNEGVYYTPLSKVLVQHPSLKNGLGSAEIKNVVMSGTNMIGLDLYEPIVYDSEDVNGFGMVIQCVSDTYCTPLTKAYDAETDGLLYTVDFVTPIDTLTAPVIPYAGDTLSYGYLDDGEFNTITNEMLITNMAQTERGWRLELVDYNPAIYEYGDIPAYTPHLTTKSPINYVPATPPAPTKGEVSETITESQGTLTISGVPVFADRETCIAECTLDEIHYLLYQDMSIGTENWEIVTINEDLSFTSFLTGSGVLNDMCQHDGKIFVSDDDGLYYIDTGELVQVYDDGIDSIQSDVADLYAIKDGKLCKFENGLYFSCVGYYDAVNINDSPRATVKIGETIYMLGKDLYVYSLTDGITTKHDFTYDTSNRNIFEYGGKLVLVRRSIPPDPLDGLYTIDFVLEDFVFLYPATSSSYDIYLSKEEEIYTTSNHSILKLNKTTEEWEHVYTFFETTSSVQRYNVLLFNDYFVVYEYYTSGAMLFLVDLENETSSLIKGIEDYAYSIFSMNQTLYYCFFYANIHEIGSSFTSYNTENVPGTSNYQGGWSNNQEAVVLNYKDLDNKFEVLLSYPYGAPVPIDETVRNYGKIRLLGDTIFAAVTDGHIYRLQDSGLVQHTQSGDGYNAITYRNGRMYCASDYVVFELKAGGTVAAVENAVSENQIVEMFDYGDYLVWCPEYTPPDTGTLYAAFVNYPGNVNVSQNITLAIPADFPIGIPKTFRRLKSYDGEPLIIVPPSGAAFEGLNLAELYGKYSYVVLERISSDLFTIVELKDEYKYDENVRVIRTKSTIEYNINDTVTTPAGYSYFDYEVPERFNPTRCMTTVTASDPTAHWTFSMLGVSLAAVSTYDNIRVSIQNDGASQDVTINVRCVVYSANVVYNTLVLENGDIVITDRGDSIAMAVLNED